MSIQTNSTDVARSDLSDGTGKIAMSPHYLLVLHVVVCCASLLYIESHYEYAIISIFSSTHLLEAASITGGFAIAGILLLGSARFSFGYLTGFYFFTVMLGYLWIAPFSRFSYNHEAAAASAFVSGLAFLLPQTFNFAVKKRFLLSEAAVRGLLLAILIAAVAAISIGALYNLRFVGLSEIYEFRDEMKFPLLLRYAIGIISTAALPFAFAFFFERHQYWRAGLCLLLLIAFYPLTLTKLAAFAPIWLLFLALLSSYFEARNAAILSLLLPLGAGLLSIPLASHSIFGLINFRMVAIPSISIDVYNDFFAHHPLTHFCQVQLLKPLMNCAYSEQLGIVMERSYHFGAFNAPMFATEGVASVGLLASPLVALVCGLLVSLVSSTTSDLPRRFTFLSAGILIQVLLNVPLTTAVLTYGAGVLFLLWYVTPASCLAPVNNERELLSPSTEGAATSRLTAIGP